ncbi:MAG: phosphate ABC transporter permease subunit PstC [Acidobacteriota bacterium]|jgi:phosphate ABC transporter, permease protein PstC|nr:phosphate ABC transporter permease subunit PstC [Acidobacteriota bacterium]OQB57755.1 MAG: Phosphate transport system permease protein PstC [Candidatus Aminicenantes bacterium ADurb.Bin147]HNQ80622.1 phosphate ABC transporter permease subunit PstC [Candidatus Aminicenantes bacterium]MDD8010904.1 phosphate ABC transporter permease subunit PstC [Acidobacteriota bacterium]MDD8029152.1 phosphate ABC transporter permease subunit PstC [Acidobacteriota bacterium]
MVKRLFKELAARRLMFLVTILPGALVFLMLFGLYSRSRSILALHSFSDLLFGSSWFPLKGEFGLYPFLMGTVWVTLAAMAIAVPVSLLSAIYLSEYAPRRIRETIKPIVDLLSGIPSVVFGVWGVLMIVPFVAKIAPAFGAYSTGYSVLAGAIVLAIMVFPTIIHVSLEVFASVPQSLRDASLSLGATKWETVKHVVLRKGLAGIIASVALGFSRAFGETMAVLMVVGNTPIIPKSVFDSAYPLPALLANNYGEMMSIPLYDGALMLAAFVLLLIVLVFNIGARVVLIRAEQKAE